MHVNPVGHTHIDGQRRAGHKQHPSRHRKKTERRRGGERDGNLVKH